MKSKIIFEKFNSEVKTDFIFLSSSTLQTVITDMETYLYIYSFT